jgi:hypothetical protein
VDDKRKEEIEKLSVIIDALESMSQPDRQRILKTVAAFYGIP